ncbi:MAG: 16S rRNA (uracil(1498)-N(3))-methyltransferase [Armatimonadetes bacterium]|nr:16S rRNA (uracil(1498)-N(3))-methyltransferase [Armatimonadota bacterium]
MKLRALPRFFLPGAELKLGPVDLPKDEFKKIYSVLRMKSGDQVAVLPNDNTIWRCELAEKQVVGIEQQNLKTESTLKLTFAQALPKGDKIEEIIRMGSEMGVAKFIIFASDRTVVKWDADRAQAKIARLLAISREACEVSCRGILPEIQIYRSLEDVLKDNQKSIVLSETESLPRWLDHALSEHPREATLVVGPEGGWSPREVDLIGDRAVTLGPRVLRTDTAAISAIAIALLTRE